ncbi:MAG: flagellar hook-basal body complex protein FliE [Methanomicrobiales archaeon]|nr:flagellar hook-basal body complex protein FliE [Methanomicrobiales archaeon]
MRVIGVVGYPASGKGEFSRVAGEEGVPVVVMGDVIRREAAKAGLGTSDAALGEMAIRLREERGMDVVALLTIREVEALRAPILLIDGLRGDAEARRFRERFPGFLLVGIVSEFGNRLARSSARGRSDDLSRAEELRNRDRREEGFGLARALAEADLVLENNGSLKEFEGKARAFFERIREGT